MLFQNGLQQDYIGDNRVCTEEPGQVCERGFQRVGKTILKLYKMISKFKTNKNMESLILTPFNL
jgi:hypothetical protein